MRYFIAMIDWLDKPHADYVISAYGIVLTTLAAVTFFSWRFMVAQNRKLELLRQARKE
jgi:hypothetical protein